MQPSQILHAIRRNLVACLVILLVCILAGLGVALATRPVAVATTTLGIQPKSKETPSFSTQAKDLMPTLVELSTSPKVLDPAAANLNMETTDLAEALTVTNPPETLVLSITAKAGSKQKAVDMAQATADSLNKELSSGELLGKQALGMTTSTTSPATTANTTMERPGARAAAISGLLLGLLASVSYAMFRHRRDSGHGGGQGAEIRPGRAAAALNALRQKTSDLLRPSQPPAQTQMQAQVPYQYQQLPAPSPVPASPEVSVIQASDAAATQSAPSSMPSPVSAPMLPGSSPAPAPPSQP
ncbi:YveK family protein, partial [Actinomyces oris]